jgi:hypothetical protein
MSEIESDPFFQELYNQFSSPLTEIDCGEKCGPYNDYGVPVCCDINLLIPAAFEKEWNYLQNTTDLWKPWRGKSDSEHQDLENHLQDGQVLLECLGYQHCQRDFRSITCRAFPFFPYISGAGDFIGLAYYRDFKDQCWIISNLKLVSQKYKQEFQKAYLRIFEEYPQSKESYFDYSSSIRDSTHIDGQQLVVMDFYESVYFVDPLTEKMTMTNYDDLDRYGPFEVTEDMLFSDEVDSAKSGLNDD